jgi:iron complex transport system substrate-binding protein
LLIRRMRLPNSIPTKEAERARGISLRAAAIAGALLFAISWCPVLCAQESSPGSATTPAYKDFVDEVGRTVRIPQPVQRIVSLAPSLTETVYAVGLQDRLVGDTDYCDYPPDAQKKTKVGGAINPSIEQIAVLRPDVVLVTKSLNRLETVHALEGLGIPAYGTEDPHTVEEIISSTLRLAEVLGVPEAGSTLAASLQKRLAALQKQLSGVLPRRVLFVVWTDPLLSVGKNTFIADALRRAGAVSVVDSTQSWPQMNLEEVVHLQPDFLIFAASHSDGGPPEIDVLATRTGWNGMDAVRNRRFAVISDAINRPAPRIFSAIEDLARQLHPEVFSSPTDGTKDKNEKVNPPSAQSSPLPSDIVLLGINPLSLEACTCVL